MAVSCHLSLVCLDLSGLPLSLTTETLHLCLAAFSSNTALSLSSLNLSGWTFSLTMTDRSQLVSALSTTLGTSRLSSLALEDCSLFVSCSPRIQSLYFQELPGGGARSLLQEIHQERVQCPALRCLNLRGMTAKVEGRSLALHRELELLCLPGLETLDLSSTAPLASCPALGLWQLVAGLSSSLKELKLEGHLLQGSLPSLQVSCLPNNVHFLLQVSVARGHLSHLARLRQLSLGGCGFLGGCLGGRLGRESVLSLVLDQLPGLEHLGLERVHLSREEGQQLARALKARTKRGAGLEVATRGGTGEGVARVVRNVSQSKHVVAELEQGRLRVTRR